MTSRENNCGWIWIREKNEHSAEQAKIVIFRKVINLSETSGDLSFKISADAKYKLYINGNLVNTGPQKSDNKIWYFDRIYASAFVKKGNNVFVVKVFSAPTRHNAANHSFFRTDTPGLYLKGNKIFADSSWKYRTANIEIKAENQHFAPMQIFEEAAGSAEDFGMMNDNYDDSSWRQALPRSEFELSPVLKPDRLAERTIPFLFTEKKNFDSVSALHSSVFNDEDWNSFLHNNCSITIPADSTEIVEISAGAETTGYLKIKMSNGRNTKISILTSECYAYEPEGDFGNFSMPRKGDRTDSAGGRLYGFTDTYLVNGGGTSERPEVYETFWFRTFRYIRLTIETADQPITLKGFHYIKNGYPLDVKTSVETSDETLTPVWEISERTLRLCMHETYEDCPFYEQLQYAMDSRSQILYTYAVSADDRLARQCMDDFRRAARHDGMINCSYPNFEPNVIPGFSIYYIGMVYDHMMYFGDRNLLLEHMPSILAILNFFRKNINSSGLLDKIGGPLFDSEFWSFIDWTKQWKETIGVPPAIKNGPLTMESLLLILGLQYSSEICSYLGYGDLAAQMKQTASEIRTAVNLLCRGKNGMYKDGPEVEEYSQHTQVFAVLTDTVDIDLGRKFIAETMDHPDEYAQCSVAMMYYLFRALEKCGLYERTDELWNVWRDMIGKNLTTCEEDPVSSRSDCHGWGALALFELPSVVLGVRPGSPGFSELEIRPVPGYLEWANGKVITPKGEVFVSWQKNDNILTVKVSAPDGVKLKNGIPPGLAADLIIK